MTFVMVKFQKDIQRDWVVYDYTGNATILRSMTSEEAFSEAKVIVPGFDSIEPVLRSDLDECP